MCVYVYIHTYCPYNETTENECGTMLQDLSKEVIIACNYFFFDYLRINDDVQKKYKLMK